MFNVFEKDLTKFSTIRTKSYCKYYAEIKIIDVGSPTQGCVLGFLNLLPPLKLLDNNQKKEILTSLGNLEFEIANLKAA